MFVLFVFVLRCQLAQAVGSSRTRCAVLGGYFECIAKERVPWVPEVFFSVGATELSGEAVRPSREAARKKPLVPTGRNLTSMPTPISLD